MPCPQPAMTAGAVMKVCRPCLKCPKAALRAVQNRWGVQAKPARPRPFTNTTRRCDSQLSMQLIDTRVSRKTRGRLGEIIAALAVIAAAHYSLVKPLKCDAGDKIDEHNYQPSGRPELISFHEVQRHKSSDDCWIIIKGHVYDITNFIRSHPGGEHAILEQAGQDVTGKFAMLHPPNALESLPSEMLLGPVDPTTLPAPEEKVFTEDERQRQEARGDMPVAQKFLLLQDFEYWAERVLSSTAWAYYRSASDEERTFYENRNAFTRYFFRPRVLRDTSSGSTETSFIGLSSSMPIFISPAAMAKLGHPNGEINLTKAAGEHGIIQVISSNASCSLEEMFDARKENQSLIFQLYLNKDRSVSKSLIKKVEKLGAKAIMFTVDVCWQSKRTLDVRSKSGSQAYVPPTSSPKGVSQAISGYQDTNLTWKDISFIRNNTDLPIIVKGVQCLEDVELCIQNGVEGVVISNHGGRQADYAPAPIDILYEIRSHRPDLFSKIDIMIDGGVRSGSDIVKALALGAKAVGIGRPFLYANGTHGEEGCRRVLEILSEEITNTMRNIGVIRVNELKPEMVGPSGPWVGINRPIYAPLITRT
ncbi:FMN-dependent dehydrogenase-domain-containing protein [Truncatella angustata]|uniref:L-lactate dehydrogenase (cytochrome) n=1 Tax=Truncatella angustata TaxID=152316 RepID=A0A9P8UV39_9PEZI|nr:FMN-dependent dehydrogenase-domain-containing protein [Truncatella angustata]KAH6658749.1 FMN-dependent dehydrogenase-domain-containing protein [Truncatella angustata]